MYKTYSMELAGRTLSVDIGRVGKQAGGCAFIHYADTTLLCTATTSAAVSSTGPCGPCSPRTIVMIRPWSAWS